MKIWQWVFLLLLIAFIILGLLLGPWYYAVVFIAGYGMLVGGFYLVAKEHVSKHWPTTQGRIIASKVVAVVDENVYGYECTPYVHYKYSIDSHKFQGDKISLTSKSPFSWKSVTKTLRETQSYSSAEKIIKCYPIGSKVLVYYNPRNPKESVLQLGVELWIVFFFFFVSAVFIGLGLLGFLGILK